MRNQSTNGFSSEVKSNIDNNKYLISTAKHPSGIWETAIFKVNFLGFANPLKPLRIKRFDTYENAEKEHSWCEEAVEKYPKAEWENTSDKDIIFTKRDFSSRQNSDDRFIAYDNGTVLDTKTNLMWAAKDNDADINWHDAKSYCESYRGGGYTNWRMPTQDELAGLYDATTTYKTDSDYEVHLTELIRLTCAAHWALETRGSEYASFLFSNGTRYWSSRPYYVNGRYWGRALPVRSGK